MSPISTAALKPGDLVLVYSPARPDGSGIGGDASGLYVVMEASAYYANVVPAATFNSAYMLKVQAADIVATIRPDAVEIAKLPPKREMDLSTPPRPPAPPAPPPAPAEKPTVIVHVVDADRRFYEMSRAGVKRYSTETISYERSADPVPCGSGRQPHYTVLLRRSDVGRFIGATPGAHEPGSLAAIVDE